jgi:prepilin-type processing-associated H-X9-DG protein
MSEAETETKGQKPKISRLALASMNCLIVSVICGVLFAQTDTSGPEFLAIGFALGGCLCLFATPILGIAALLKIKDSNVLLAGRGLAIAALSISAFFIVLGFIIPQMGKTSPKVYRLQCMAQLYAMGSTMRLYSVENEDRYPDADKWCDLLKKYLHEPERRFVCKISNTKAGQCSYALNQNIVGMKTSGIPPNVVLLFESVPGWNQCGGPELLNTENHKGKGCNILFNDGRVEFVKTEQLGELKWKVEQKQ